MEFLVGVLCISIGCAVTWVLALYTPRGPSPLIWDSAFGVAGAAVCAAVLGWAALPPALTLAGLVVLGPFCSLAAIYAADAMGRLLKGAGVVR